MENIGSEKLNRSCKNQQGPLYPHHGSRPNRLHGPYSEWMGFRQQCHSHDTKDKRRNCNYGAENEAPKYGKLLPSLHFPCTFFHRGRVVNRHLEVWIQLSDCRCNIANGEVRRTRCVANCYNTSPETYGRLYRNRLSEVIEQLHHAPRTITARC